MTLSPSWQTIQTQSADGLFTIVFDRPHRQNAFNPTLLEEFLRALDLAERTSGCNVVVLKGQHGFFSQGLDLEEGLDAVANAEPPSPAPYMDVLRKLTLVPRFVVAVVQGQVTAGGLGFVAASDFAVATPESRFSLPEAMFGIVPACVGLYLTRRIGPKMTARLSLLSETLDAASAREAGLIDEVAAAPDVVVRRIVTRAMRLSPSTIGDIKRFFRGVAGLEEDQEKRALAETARLMDDPGVRQAVTRFIREKRFPWE
jgi:polyketide biosynthesis enoyl-CoA hydratase PksH